MYKNASFHKWYMEWPLSWKDDYTIQCYPVLVSTVIATSLSIKINLTLLHASPAYIDRQVPHIVGWLPCIVEILQPMCQCEFVIN